MHYGSVIRWDDNADESRCVFLACEGEQHRVMVSGSTVTLLDGHDMELVRASVAFGADLPACMRTVAACADRWSRASTRPSGQQFSTRDGWRRKVAIIAAFCSEQYDIRLPDSAIDATDWQSLAQGLFWSSLDDDHICGWVAAGLVQLDQIRPWEAVVSPDEAAVWTGSGYSDPRAVEALIRSGVSDPVTAGGALRAVIGMCDQRVSPDDCVYWSAVGVTTRDALDDWMTRGFTDPRLAWRWSAVGFTAEQAQQWDSASLEGGAVSAAAWRDAGFSPASAATAVKGGANGCSHALTLIGKDVLPDPRTSATTSQPEGPEI